MESTWTVIVEMGVILFGMVSDDNLDVIILSSESVGDDDLQILNEIPGKSGHNAASSALLDAYASRGAMGLAGLSGLLGAGVGSGAGSNPLYNPSSILQAQDPYFNLSALQAGSSSNANTLDILQKSIQNGGLGSILNQYNFLSGGGITGTTSGVPGSSLLKSNNYPIPQSLNRSQISSLWNNGPAAGLLGSIPRGPYGLGGSSPFMGRLGPGGIPVPTEEEEANAEDEEDMGVIETYSNYWPSKLKIGKPHPDPVVETASLASVEPPDVWYEMSLPEETVNKAKLSALQLESVTYAVSKF